MKVTKRIVIIFLITIEITYSTHNIAIIHGLDDSCTGNLPRWFIKTMKLHTNAEVKCIESGAGRHSYLNPMEEQSQLVCKTLRNDPAFNIKDGKFHMIGISQGNLIIRWIIGFCKLLSKVDKVVSLDGAHLGIVESQFRKAYVWSFMLSPLNLVSDGNGPSEYFLEKMDIATDIDHMPEEKFIAKINNINPEVIKYLENHGEELLQETHYTNVLRIASEAEENKVNQAFKNALALREANISIGGYLLLHNERDDLVQPGHSAFFGYYLNKSERYVFTYFGSQFYKADLSGIVQLVQKGVVKFVPLGGEHLSINIGIVKKYIFPFLLDEHEERVRLDKEKVEISAKRNKKRFK
jgi:hypothetical protein